MSIAVDWDGQNATELVSGRPNITYAFPGADAICDPGYRLSTEGVGALSRVVLTFAAPPTPGSTTSIEVADLPEPRSGNYIQFSSSAGEFVVLSGTATLEEFSETSIRVSIPDAQVCPADSVESGVNCTPGPLVVEVSAVSETLGEREFVVEDLCVPGEPQGTQWCGRFDTAHILSCSCYTSENGDIVPSVQDQDPNCSVD